MLRCAAFQPHDLLLSTIMPPTCQKKNRQKLSKLAPAAQRLKNQQCICSAFSVKCGTQACNKKLCASSVGHSADMVP